jgi:predicted PurR-regulated permease PerM
MAKRPRRRPPAASAAAPATAPSAPADSPILPRIGADQHDIVARIFFFALLLGLTVVVLDLFAPYVTDVVMAILFASLLAPLMRWLMVRLRVKWVAALLCCLVVALVVVGPVVFVVVTLSREAAIVIGAARTTLTMDSVNAYLFGEGWLATRARSLATTLSVPFTPDSVKAAGVSVVGTVATFLYERTNALVSNVLVFVFHLFITFLSLFYLLVDGQRFRDFVRRASPLPDDEDDLILSRFQAVGRAILWGNGVGSVVQGVVGAMAMALAGFESPVVWGAVMAFAAFLPMVGISLVTVPAALYMASQGRVLAALVFIGVTGAFAFIFENVVKTKMIGSQVRMHDFVILLSILGGMGIFGLMGLLYGPMMVALFLVMLELYQARYRAGVER